MFKADVRSSFHGTIVHNYLSDFSIDSYRHTFDDTADDGREYSKTVALMNTSSEKVYVDIKLIQLLATKDISNTAKKVLAYILTNIKYGYNHIILENKDIAKTVDVNETNVSKGISELKQKNIIVKAKDLDIYKDATDMPAKLYILNHNYAIKGSFDKLKTEVDKQESTLKRNGKFLPQKRIMY